MQNLFLSRSGEVDNSFVWQSAITDWAKAKKHYKTHESIWNGKSKFLTSAPIIVICANKIKRVSAPSIKKEKSVGKRPKKKKHSIDKFASEVSNETNTYSSCWLSLDTPVIQIMERDNLLMNSKRFFHEPYF